MRFVEWICILPCEGSQSCIYLAKPALNTLVAPSSHPSATRFAAPTNICSRARSVVFEHRHKQTIHNHFLCPDGMLCIRFKPTFHDAQQLSYTLLPINHFSKPPTRSTTMPRTRTRTATKPATRTAPKSPPRVIAKRPSDASSLQFLSQDSEREDTPAPTPKRRGKAVPGKYIASDHVQFTATLF
jgi:hypothetical protein